MSLFAKNLASLRSKKGVSQQEVAECVGVSKATLSDYERGKTEPNFSVLLKLSDFFGVTADGLLYSQSEAIAEVQSGQEVHPIVQPHVQLKGKKGQKTGIEMAPSDLDTELDIRPGKSYNVFDLESRAAAGNALLLLDEDKRKSLPNMYLPDLGFGLHLRLPISGDSMEPTIRDGDRVVATWVSDLSEMREGWPHVIIDAEDGIVCKRLYRNDKKSLEFHSDNEVYKPYPRRLEGILAIFKVREVHSKDLHNAMTDLHRDIRQIRQEMDEFRRLLKAK